MDNRKSFDTISLNIMSDQLAADLHKALPPRIEAKLRSWFRRQGARLRFKGVKDKTDWADQVASAITQKMEEALSVQSLQKNQMMARVHDNGVVKLDFGADVPDSIKKAAIGWAKRKGLKPIEASLAKSKNSTYSVTYHPQVPSQARGDLLAQYVWEIS